MVGCLFALTLCLGGVVSICVGHSGWYDVVPLSGKTLYVRCPYALPHCLCDVVQ